MHIFAPLFIFLLALVSCDGRNHPIRATSEEYADRKICWNGHGRVVEGFIIVRRNSVGDYFPRFLSAHCYMDDDMSFALGTDFRVVGDNGELKRHGAIDKTLSNNIVTDQMPASEFVAVLAFRGALRPVTQPVGLPPAYVLDEIEFARDTGLTMDDIVSLGPTERWDRFQRAAQNVGS